MMRMTLQMIVQPRLEPLKHGMADEKRGKRHQREFDQQYARGRFPIEENRTQTQYERGYRIVLIQVFVILRDNFEIVEDRYQPEQDGVEGVHEVARVAHINVQDRETQSESAHEHNLQAPQDGQPYPMPGHLHAENQSESEQKSYLDD